MIKSVTAINQLGESVTIELGSPEKSGFLILGIDGLGPSKATINMTDILSDDGAVFNSSRVSTRNILLHLSFMGWPASIEGLRQESYRYFPVKTRVELIFEMDNRTCWTYGYVESNTPSIFSKDEGTDISIICPDSYFYSQDTQVTLFSGVVPAFSFPFSNESITSNLVKFGDVSMSTSKTIYYEGEALAGVVMFMHALGPVINPTIFNIRTRESMRIDSTKLSILTGYGIIAGDDIIISTIKGDKFIVLQRDGVVVNILNCIDKNSSWFQISKGDNIFAYVADAGIANLQFRVENQVIYEGI